MSDVRSYEPLSHLIAELETLCRNRSTGMVFIVTDDNQMARLNLKAGEIDFISFHHKRGKDALAMFSNIHAGLLRFEAGHTAENASMDLPSTVDILEYLANPAGSPGVPADSSAPKHTGMTLSASRRVMIEEVLTEFIGPMASLVCEEVMNAAPDLESGLRSLAAQIQESSQAQDFLTQVHARLSKPT